MHKARTMQTHESVFYVDLTADFEYKLPYRPRALLIRQRQPVVDAVLDDTGVAQDIACVWRRVVLHGKVPPFLATAPGCLRSAGAKLWIDGP